MSDRYHLRLGDSSELLRKLQSESIDALVCDPPAGISFMGKEWDSFSGDARQPGGDFPVSNSGPHRRATVKYGDSSGYGNIGARVGFIKSITPIFSECLRVLKPGAHGLVWAFPRTSHWTATALEDAGFEIRDVVLHLFGTGFPKSLDVSKAIDKAAGVPPDAIEVNEGGSLGGLGDAGWNPTPRRLIYGDAKTDDAKKWAGWGTALKPAAEHWILVRKPLVGTVAENVLAHGTGGINIDGCRISSAGETFRAPQSDPSKRVGEVGTDLGITRKSTEAFQAAQRESIERTRRLGRFPANVTLDEEAAAMLDAQSGDRPSGAMQAGQPRVKTMNGGGYHGGFKTAATEKEIEASSGGASRFFYAAKASRSDRGEGNTHPTVKSTVLMRWLCRLITPSGGIILDPFMGSGSTGVAAIQEGFQFIGIEREKEYFEMAQRRLEEATTGT